MAAKPLTVRLLEQRKIAHQVYAFDATIRAADEVARHTGVDPVLVYKTLVVEQDPPTGKPFVVMIPSTCEIDLKRFAASINVKKLRMASHRDAERYTGLQVGGISALALLGKGFSFYIEAEALQHQHILVSAGRRGMDVRLAVDDLVAITGATPVRAARDAIEP